jgi:hypothetical protein
VFGLGRKNRRPAQPKWEEPSPVLEVLNELNKVQREINWLQEINWLGDRRGDRKRSSSGASLDNLTDYRRKLCSELRHMGASPVLSETTRLWRLPEYH